MKNSIVTFILCITCTLAGMEAAQGQEQDIRYSSGTGFFISRDGYLVTNHHVISNAKYIWITEIKPFAEELFYAEVVATDVANDIAILQIRDREFKGLPKPVPFTLKSSSAQVAEECYTVGYPLTYVMGMEPKRTQGSISALSGFRGDISQYQIDMSSFSGNSGGPLFDKKGNIIGIVSSGLRNLETVTYAVKSKYILDLLGSLRVKSDIPKSNKMSRKSVQEQFVQIRDFVCLVYVGRNYPVVLQEEISTHPTYSWENGDKYKGEDMKNGMGACFWNNGNIYFGHFTENNRNGYGVALADGGAIANCPNAKYYVGNWLKGDKSGIGTCYDGDGKLIYRGEFKDNKPTGKYPSSGNYSTYRFEFKGFDDVGRYVGETKDGKKHGYGVVVWEKGGMWFGAWKDGLRDGGGILIAKDGTTQSGTWRGDKYTPVSTVVQSTKSTQSTSQQRIVVYPGNESAQNTQNTSGQIEKVWADYHAVQDGQNGIKIHVKFSVQGMLQKQGLCSAWFYYESGEKLVLTTDNGAYTTASKQVSVAGRFTPGYENTVYEDFVLFIPYSAFPSLGKGKFGFKFYVGIMDNSNKQLASSEEVSFTLSW